MASRSAFLAAIGHDLRTPIGAILTGSAEMDRAATDSLGARPCRPDHRRRPDDEGLARQSAGPFQTRCGSDDGRGRGLQPSRLLAQTMRLWAGPVRAKGLSLRVEGAASHARHGARRRDAPAPDPQQPGLQRDEIHRRGIGHPAASGLARGAERPRHPDRGRRYRPGHDPRAARAGCSRPSTRRSTGSAPATAAPAWAWHQPRPRRPDGRAPDGAQHAGRGAGSPCPWCCRARASGWPLDAETAPTLATWTVGATSPSPRLIASPPSPRP